MVDCVEEAGDVRVQYPVHRPAADAIGQRIQRLVRVSPGAEAVGEPHERRFVDRIEHFHYRALDDFVLQRGNAQWPLPSIRAGV